MKLSDIIENPTKNQISTKIVPKKVCCLSQFSNALRIIHCSFRGRIYKWDTRWLLSST